MRSKSELAGMRSATRTPGASRPAFLRPLELRPTPKPSTPQHSHQRRFFAKKPPCGGSPLTRAAEPTARMRRPMEIKSVHAVDRDSPGRTVACRSRTLVRTDGRSARRLEREPAAHRWPTGEWHQTHQEVESCCRLIATTGEPPGVRAESVPIRSWRCRASSVGQSESPF